MSKTLCSRLDDLENEIQVMLTLQEPGGCCSMIRAEPFTSDTDDNCYLTPSEKPSSQTQAFAKVVIKQPLPVPKCDQPRPVSSPESSQRKRVCLVCNGVDSKSVAGADGVSVYCRHHKPQSLKAVSATVEQSFCICSPLKSPPSCLCVSCNKITQRTCICGPNIGGSRTYDEGVENSGRTSQKAGRKLVDEENKWSEAGETITGKSKKELDDQNKKDTGDEKTEEEMSKKELVEQKQKNADGDQSKGKSGKAENGVGSEKADPDAKKSLGDIKKEFSEEQQKHAETEKLLAKLRKELEKIEKLLKESQGEKEKALTNAKEILEKYEKLATDNGMKTNELAQLRKQSQELNAKHEQEAEQRRNKEEQLHKNLAIEKKKIIEKVEKVELHAAKSAKKVQSQGQLLATAIKQRDEHIKKLSDTSEKLADTIREKEAQNRKLHENQSEMGKIFTDVQYANKILTGANSALSKNVKEFQDKLHAKKATVQKFQKQISEYKEKSGTDFEEIEKLKERLGEALQGPKDARLQNTLGEARERENRYLDEQSVIEAKNKQMQENQDYASVQTNNELDRMMKDHKKLQSKYDELMKKMEMEQEAHATKLACVEEELLLAIQETKAKQESMLKERNELQADFDSLTGDSRSDKKILEDLIKRTRDQSVVLKAQQEAIASKDEIISSQNKQITTLKEDVNGREAEIGELKQFVGYAETLLQKTERAGEALKKQLKVEREIVLKNEETIASHMAKIEVLRVAAGDYQSKLQIATEELRVVAEGSSRHGEHMKQLTGELLSLRKDNVQIVNDVAEEKLVLKGKLNQLESTVQAFCKSLPLEFAQNKRTTDLGIKVELLEREMKLQVALITKQKQRALDTAKFASQRLLETVSDFQEQAKTHKKVQHVLTKMLRESAPTATR